MHMIWKNIHKISKIKCSLEYSVGEIKYKFHFFSCIHKDIKLHKNIQSTYITPYNHHFRRQSRNW